MKQNTIILLGIPFFNKTAKHVLQKQRHSRRCCVSQIRFDCLLR
jgi:hypothetical protein